MLLSISPPIVPLINNQSIIQSFNASVHQSMNPGVGLSIEAAYPAFLYGKHLGIAFQLVDDLLDFVSSADQLGKPAAADLELGKNFRRTFVDASVLHWGQFKRRKPYKSTICPPPLSPIAVLCKQYICYCLFFPQRTVRNVRQRWLF